MKKIVLLLAALGIGLLPFFPEPSAETTTWSLFPGRFHILLLHFPIVLVLGLLCVEIGSWFWPKFKLDQLRSILLTAALVSCFFTVVAGYLLYLSGEYQGDLARDHLWGGVLLTNTLAIIVLLRLFFPKEDSNWFRWTGRGLVIVAGLLVIYTSHLGGSLTHGAEFLSEYAPSLRPEPISEAEQKPPEELLVFQDLIMPALDNRCLSCHNEHKTKGDLLMTSYASLKEGGKSEKPVLVAGDPEQSELCIRITLPADDDDHMPPPEKPALSEDEIALIKWWVAEGASPEMQLGEGPPGPEGAALIERYLPTLFRAQRLKLKQQRDIETLHKELKKLARKLNLFIEPDEEAPGYFAVSLVIPPPVVTDQTVAKLLPYAEVFSKISLPGSDITDEALYDFSKMPNLQKLYLPKTCIKGDGLVYLQSLKQLKELNLSYTFLDDAGALKIMDLPQLEKAYLFGTHAEANVLEALRKNLPDMEVLEVEGAYF